MIHFSLFCNLLSPSVSSQRIFSPFHGLPSLTGLTCSPSHVLVSKNLSSLFTVTHHHLAFHLPPFFLTIVCLLAPFSPINSQQKAKVNHTNIFLLLQSGIAAWPLMIPLSPSDEMAVDMIKVVEFVKVRANVVRFQDFIGYLL